MGLILHQGTHILVQNNVIRSSYSGGIYVAKSRVNNIEIRGNFLSSNSLGKGIGALSINNCHSVRVVNNIVCGSGHHNIYLKGVKKVQFWNNVISPDKGTGKFIWLIEPLEEVDFRNNIFDFTRSRQKLSGPIDKVAFDYNCYFTLSETHQLYQDYIFRDLQSSQNSFETNGIWADPAFTDSKRQLATHFMLSVGSPCHNAGDSIPLFSDFLDNERGTDGHWDIGAFEF